MFDTVEHERGKIIVSQQTWNLAEGGKVLREVKHEKETGKPEETVAVFEKR